MPVKPPVAQRNLDRYGDQLIPWEPLPERLAEALYHQAPETGGPNRHTSWLATTNPDGRPHVVPVGVLWVDGAFYFTSGAGTRKAKNIAADPRCSITVATHAFDVVAEGEAVRVTDASELERLAGEYARGGWAPEVRGGSFWAEFSAPSAGPPPWDLYRLTPATVFAFGTAEPYGATRFQF